MKKDNKIFLEHILEAINNIEDYVKDIVSQEEFASNKIVGDAVLRNFQIIGEAANNLDENFIKNSSEVGWEKVIGMRNFIIHEYFGVDLKIVWDTITEDISSFKKLIEDLLKKSNLTS